MLVILTILVLLNLVLTGFGIWVVWRLNRFISKLEEIVDDQIDRCDNLQSSLSQALKEDLLYLDGSFKKPLISKEEQE